MSHAELLDAPTLPAMPTADPAWLLVEEGFDLAREHELESLFTVANGYLGTRGSLAEGSALSFPATFVAGVFDTRPQPGAVPELVVAPDWLCLQIHVDGQTLQLEHGTILTHRRMLDLRQGILWREWRQRDPAGRITAVRSLRLASLADRHVLLHSVAFTPENYSGRLRLESRIGRRPREGRVTAPPPHATTAVFRTAATGITVAFASAGRLHCEAETVIAGDVELEPGALLARWEIEVEIGRTYRLDRLVTVYTSRDTARPAEAAAARLASLYTEGVERTLAAHTKAWEARWRAADVEIEGDADAQRALRFAAYHLIAAANPVDERVSVGARALTGETYKGHVFWDTEIFMLPFYLVTHPASARALLMYRYHTLPAARAKTRAFRYRGALYAWESADTGAETTPRFAVLPGGERIEIRTGELEHHISADVAYAIWQYWRATGDDDFFRAAGAEIVLETARFWASRCTLGEDGRYHITDVIGPDEYHEDVDDNAYTNLMAQWNLERGAETAALLQARWPDRWRELSRTLALTADEADAWRGVAAAMYTGFDPATGLYEQFRGYFDLEEIDLRAYEPRTAPMEVLLGLARLRQSKAIKQADVVMALYLLWDRFSPEVRAANFRYYEPRTSHGSSLSPAIHALVAARLGDLGLAARYFRQGAEIDLANTMGNAAGGVHVGALGGLWQAAVFGFGGLSLSGDAPAFDPHLPPGWRTLRFRMWWRGRQLRVRVGGGPPDVEIAAEDVT